MGPVIPKEMEYNLRYCEVRGDVLPPPPSTNMAKHLMSAVSTFGGFKGKTTLILTHSLLQMYATLYTFTENGILV